MKRILLITAIALGTQVQAQSFQWLKQFEGSYTKDIERDGAGNVYMVADYKDYYCSTNHYQSTTNKFFISKYDSSDICQWVKDWPVSHDETAMDENGALYITGRFSGTVNFNGNTLTSRGDEDIYLAKFNSNGDVVWIKQAGGPEMDDAADLSVRNGTIHLVGTFGSSIQIGNSTFNRSHAATRNFFIARFNTSGALQWLQTADSYYDTYVHDVGTDDAGNGYVMVTAADTAVYGTYSLDHDGSPFYICGIIKYNAAGVVQWGKNLMNSYRLTDQNLAVDKNGNLYTFRQFTYSLEGVKKYNTNGTQLWDIGYGGSYSTNCADVKINASGDLFITGNVWPDGVFGTIQYPGNYNGKMYTARLSSAGVFKWVVVAESNEEPTTAGGEAIAVSSTDKCYLMGYVSGNGYVNFGQQTATTAAGTAYFAKIDSAQVTSVPTVLAGDEDLHLNPNPNSGTFTVHFCRADVEDDDLTLEIVNAVGQVVYKKRPAVMNGCVMEVIELEKGLPGGIYILNVVSGSKKESRRLVLAY